ncbi:MAG: glycosyltransferase family 4 protein [Phycisphaerales bacterium]|nr:glycosyltransferase family 4 protein [Phycisphaerales bacterium]
MRVLLNDRVLLRPLTGVGHYVSELLGALRSHTEVELRTLVSRARPTVSRSVTGAADATPTAPPRSTSRRIPGVLRGLLEVPYRAALRWAARRCDLYHEPNHIPVPCGRPTVTTIHDLSVLLHPEWHPADRVRWYERQFAAGLRQTRVFLAASEATRREMVTHLGTRPEQIRVTYQAPRALFRPQPPEVVAGARAALDLPADFLLFVGTLEPRKNVNGLIRAYAALPGSLRARVPLVLAGGWGWHTEQISTAVQSPELRACVRLVGYQDDQRLAALYTACTALAWPTLYEGFGLPPLEALACGAMVITSNTTSLPEVVGDAGVLLDPHDTPAWTEALRRAIEDDAWRAGWRARATARAACFSWQRCADQTFAGYRAALAP